MTETHAYGAWPSPVSAAAIAAGASTLAELRSHADTLYWLESRPQEAGRTTLMAAVDGNPPRELTPAPFSVRSRVNEYGGGAYLPCDAGVFFIHDGDGDLYLERARGDTCRLTDWQRARRLGDLCWDPLHQRIIAVCEQPRTTREPENSLIALSVDVDLGTSGECTTLHRGHDFYAAPRLAPNHGHLAFVAWDHPNMPWDGAFLKLAHIDAEGLLGAETVIAGGASEAVQQPLWLPDESLVFISDINGFWNVYRYDPSGLHGLLTEGAEYAEAPWNLGQSSIVAVGPGHLVAVRFADGAGELVLIDAQGGFASPLPADWLEYQSLCTITGALAFIGSRADGPPAIVIQPLDGAAPRVVTRASMPAIAADAIAFAQPRSFPTRDGARVHANVYQPRNPRAASPAGERPPLLVMVHGGPTARTSAALNLRVQYFTSRGWDVLDVDYRGSSGYGRQYREALNGRWGQRDVSDCEDAVRGLLLDGLVDAARIAIRGSSAGGFTVLSALTQSTLFGAGASLYGIGDLAALARETHNFESRYLDTLVGDQTALAARSPLRHVQRIRSPVIFLQGADDRIVPPGQANAMVAALRERRVPVAHIEFPGEGHGFRLAAHIERALESEYAFFCRIFGIQPHDTLPRLEIVNL